MNEVHFYCLHCASPMEAPKDRTNDISECPRCLRVVPIPPESANEFTEWPRTYPADIISVEIKFPCPQCASKLEIDARNAGATVYCPVCTNEIKAPHLAFVIMPPHTTAPAKKIEFAKTGCPVITGKIPAKCVQAISSSVTNARPAAPKSRSAAVR